MIRHASETMLPPRFGLAGAAAMVAVSVAAQALTAAGPTSPSSDAQAASMARETPRCVRCGRTMADHDSRAAVPVADPAGEAAVCSQCVR